MIDNNNISNNTANTKKIKENIKYPPHVRNAIIHTLQAKKFSQTEISKILDITPQYLSTLVKSDNVNINYTDIIREEIRKSVLKAICDKIVYSINESDLEKASLQQKVTSAAILIEKYRLLEGKSTTNISVSQLITLKNELEKKKADNHVSIDSMNKHTLLPDNEQIIDVDDINKVKSL